MDLELPTFSETDTKKGILSKRQAPPTVCQVCQGKATGHHYDIPSCNGCKSFFRRVTIENRGYICKYIDQCFARLEPGDRMPKCRSCRFKKCVEVGMNPMGIQFELKEKGKAISIIQKPRKTIDTQVGELIDKMLIINAQSEKFRDCAFNPKQFPSLKECVKQEYSMLSIADKYEPMKGWPLQQKTINEQSKPFIKNWIMYELLTQIELAKTLSFYSDLSESDRYFLALDTVLMSTNLTKAYYSFEKKSDRLMRPDGIGYYDQPFLFYDEFRMRFRDDIGMRCLSVILRHGLDRVEFVLLRVLVLTNPAISELSADAQKCLTKERQKYNTALFRYIMAKHGSSGPARFTNILGFIDILEHQQRDHRDLSSFINLTKPRHKDVPLIDEIMKH